MFLAMACFPEVQRRLQAELDAVVGHDRGGRVAYRMALDHPERVTRLAVLDIVPTGEAFRRADMAFGMGYWHWFFLAQAPDLPERMIAHDPDDWLRTCLARWSAPGTEFDPDAVEQYLRWFRSPGAIAASCEDYRAGATIDLEHDRADRDAGRRLAMPVGVLSQDWGGALGFDPTALWDAWTSDLTYEPTTAGHWMAERAPDVVTAFVRGLLARPWPD